MLIYSKLKQLDCKEAHAVSTVTTLFTENHVENLHIKTAATYQYTMRKAVKKLTDIK